MKIQFVERLLTDATYDPLGGYHLREDLQPGSAQWCRDKRSLLFICPCGCSRVQTVPVIPESAAKVSGGSPETTGPSSLRFDATSRSPVLPHVTHEGWEWNGNAEHPTFKPSIRIMEQDLKTEHWHGHLINGDWVRC